MRDKKLSDTEEKMRATMDNPDIPNGYSGEAIMLYKMYLSLLERVEFLEGGI